MTCECAVCRYAKEVEAHLGAIPEPHRAFFQDMYERLCSTEEDCDYFRMKIDNGELQYLSKSEQIMLKIMMSSPDANEMIRKKDIDTDSQQ